MARYVADTHALLWYLGGSPLLGSSARAAFDGAVQGTNEVIIPAIVLAEAIMLTEKRRTAIDIDHIVATVQAAPGFRFTPLMPEMVARIQTLTSLPDIHDRLIVAEALVSSATVITRDHLVITSGIVSTVW
jgi:PIN domain nuclease of toxin-antitoxin system